MCSRVYRLNISVDLRQSDRVLCENEDTISRVRAARVSYHSPSWAGATGISRSQRRKHGPSSTISAFGVKVNNDIRRVVSLVPTNSEMVCLLDCERLIGGTRYDFYPAELP